MAATATVPGATAALPQASTSPDSRVGAVLAWCGLVLLLLARGYRAFVVTLLMAAMLPMLWGWTSYVVRSGSMEPALSVGDVVVAMPFSSDSHVPVGKVMLFTPPGESRTGDVRVHRVVENLGKDSYLTAGDANRSNDPDPVPASSFRARPLICVPFVALPLTWWYARDLVPLLVLLVLTMAAFYVSSRPPCDPTHRRRRTRTRARRALDKAGPVVRRAGVPIAAALAITVAAASGLAGQADASFAATSISRGNTWKVSSSLANSLVLTTPGAVVRGTVPLTATLSNAGTLAYSVRMEYAAAGTTTWGTICTKTSAPYTCGWLTTGLGNRTYDLRAVATSGSTSYTSALVEDVLVDNLAPTVTMQDPGSPLSGTVTLAATASDAHSGVARVVIQYAATGSATYTNACTVSSTPWSCRFDTTVMPRGSYTLRAVATDVAGNTTTSAGVTNRFVDNTVSSIVMNDPGAFLSGTVTLTATASSTAGVTSVRIQGAPAGSTAWTDVCTDTTSPYTCAYNTATAPDGLYDVRAILLDGTGRTTISAVVANRKVDNTAPRAFDVQTSSGGTAGRLSTGDTITYTYTEQMKPSSFIAGWDGTALGTTVRLRDGNLLGLGSRGDSIDILRTGSAVNLGSVNLREDYISSNLTAQFAATMTASTTTVNGVTATRITLTVGAQTSGTTPKTVTQSAAMTWAPSTLATDLAGRAVATASATESGAADREF